jgi:hypothetical protein
MTKTFRHGSLQFPERYGFEMIELSLWKATKNIKLKGYSTYQDSCSDQQFEIGDKIKKIQNGDAYNFSRWERIET